MRIDLQPAYILHTRNYRDSSLLVEFLTPDYGRVSGVVRGVRSTGKSAKQRRSLVQPFLPLLISWSGNTDLKTITHFERNGGPLDLKGQRLFSAMYMNELLIRLLQNYEQSPEIYALYQWALKQLLDVVYIDVALRQFEMQLLHCLGYGIDLSTAVKPDAQYHFDVDNGFVTNNPNQHTKENLFLGSDLIAITQGNYTEHVRKTAKRLCRLALSTHLGTKPLKSRELFT
ncbi:DNA repair protein RecO [bacterium AH-315-K03]|nr:DNA repair protein RecO [bacterium AH-315-K03]